MKSTLLLTCFLLVVSLAPGALDAQPQPQNQNLTPVQFQGAQVFKQRCGVCHLLTVVGANKGQTLVMKGRLYGPMLTKDALSKLSDDAIRAQIREGSGRMPGFQYSLMPAQISAIVEYLRTVEKPAEIGYSAGSENEDN